MSAMRLLIWTLLAVLLSAMVGCAGVGGQAYITFIDQDGPSGAASIGETRAEDLQTGEVAGGNAAVVINNADDGGTDVLKNQSAESEPTAPQNGESQQPE